MEKQFTNLNIIFLRCLIKQESAKKHVVPIFNRQYCAYYETYLYLNIMDNNIISQIILERKRTYLLLLLINQC